jgi:hypothetical protein
MSRQDAFLKARQYTELKNKFVEICSQLIDALPPENQYGIEIGTGTHLTHDISVLRNPCKLIFGTNASMARNLTSDPARRWRALF